MSEPTPQQTPQSSIARAKELTGELRRLQEHVESLDAAVLQDNVAKVLGLCSGCLPPRPLILNSSVPCARGWLAAAEGTKWAQTKP